MANGMEMLVNALLKATGFSMDDMKREATQAYEMLKRFAGEQTRATEGIERIEQATARIERRLDSSPELPSEHLYPSLWDRTYNPEHGTFEPDMPSKEPMGAIDAFDTGHGKLTDGR